MADKESEGKTAEWANSVSKNGSRICVNLLSGTTDKFSYLDEFALNVGRRCTSVLKLQSNHNLTFVANQRQRFSFRA
jgi:hypothetical protein